MSIDDSFYKNVFLLMQVVPASVECTKQFKKGMFNKPNTLGFLYVSHYLLSVYNANQFKNMVKWPIMEKKDERQYCTEMKQYLEILKSENPDVNFPLILISHLLKAGGMKFLIIMWKISEISLRAYIARNCQITLFNAPNVRNNNDITRTYFTNTNIKRDIVILEFSERIKLISQSYEHCIEDESNDIKEIQTAIFKAKDNIEKYIQVAPINPSIVEQLKDPENSEIIDLWKTNIQSKILHLLQKNKDLKKLQRMSDSLDSLVSNVCINSKSFDGNKLLTIDYNATLLSNNYNIQHFSHGLYRNNCLVLHVFLLIFHEILKQLHCSLKVHTLLDLSDCESKINKYCKIIQSIEERFQCCIEQISDISHDLNYSLQKSLNYTIQTGHFNSMVKEIISHSPQFTFSSSCYTNVETLLESLHFSPIKGKYKHLFKRYKGNFLNSPKLSIPRIKLSYIEHDDIESIRNWKSPPRQLVIHEKHSPTQLQLSTRYSQLFSSNEFKHRDIVVSTPKPKQINRTLERFNFEISKTQQINIGAAMKNIFDLSHKITNVVTALCKNESSNTSIL